MRVLLKDLFVLFPLRFFLEKKCSYGMCSGLLLLFVATFITSPLKAEEVTRVTMAFELGNVEIDLYGDKAPMTVKNFLRYVDAGHFSGGTIYRVVRYENDNGSPKIEVIQGGAREGTDFDPIGHETTEQTGILHKDGVISMARGPVGTATSAFFICIGDQPALDYGESRNADMQGFAAFGKVVSGMEIIKQIHQMPSDAPQQDAYVKGQYLNDPVKILSVDRNP